MSRSGSDRRIPLFCFALLASSAVLFQVADAQEPTILPRVQMASPGPRPICTSPVASTLGTFQPTPYLMVRGNWPSGGGYSPLEYYGDGSLTLYGPLSQFRSVSAPVMTYTRAYDGRLYAQPATSFSTPNQPELSPVVYPTATSYYYAPRVSRTPPQWTSGFNWIDQN